MQTTACGSILLCQCDDAIYRQGEDRHIKICCQFVFYYNKTEEKNSHGSKPIALALDDNIYFIFYPLIDDKNQPIIAQEIRNLF